MSNLVRIERVNARRVHAPAEWSTDRKPWRVVVLALFAVIITTAAMGEASALLRSASHQRYADDLIRARIASIQSQAEPHRS